MAQNQNQNTSTSSDTDSVQLSMSVETTKSECYDDLKGEEWETKGINAQGEEVGNCYHPGDTTMGKSK